MRKKRLVLLLAFALSVALTVPAVYAASRDASSKGQTLQPVAVHTNVPQGAPIEIQDVQATPAPLGSTGIHYKITNNSTLRLTAIEIQWNLKFAHRTPMRTVVRRDYFFSPTALAPGASDHFMVGGIENKSSGVKWDPLQDATATVSYAEFANGTQYGSDIRPAARWFASYRTESAEFYQQALAAYQAGEMAGLTQAMSWRREPGTMGGRAAWMNLHEIEEKKGSSGLITELTRLASLKPSNQ